MRFTPAWRIGLAFGLFSMPAPTPQAQTSTELRSPATFESIADLTTRSQALFSEIAKVLASPRCMNCHPAGDRPTQGNDLHPHQPPVWRAAGACQTCHTDRNYTLMERASYKSIPGHPSRLLLAGLAFDQHRKLWLLAGANWAICALLFARGVLTFIASRFCILLLSKGVVLRGAWARRCTFRKAAGPMRNIVPYVAMGGA